MTFSIFKIVKIFKKLKILKIRVLASALCAFIICIFSFLNYAYADDVYESYDYIILDVQKINVNIENPMAKFSLYDTEKKLISSDDNFYDSDKYEFDITAPEITLKEGQKIHIRDESIPGAGNKIVKWDLQIYSSHNEVRYIYENVSDVEKEIVLDNPGKWLLFLCVMDDYPKVNQLENWSVNGNHRFLSKLIEDNNKKIWWYFTQLNINVLSEEEWNEYEQGKKSCEDGEDIKDIDDKKDDEIHSVEIINHNPETSIWGGDILYSNDFPSEFTSNNIIYWDYYDMDGDDITDSGYQLYKYENGKKVLMKEESNLVKAKNRKIKLEGNMLDKFFLSVWVKDSEGKIGRNEHDFTINEFFPNVKMKVQDEVYIGDKLQISFNISNDLDENKYIIPRYVKYKIFDSYGNIITSASGKIKNDFLIDNEIFNEGSTYRIKQIISNGFSEREIYGSFFVVDVLSPSVNMKNILGFLGKEYSTNLSIVQNQSRLKKNIDDYVCEFNESNSEYFIYDMSNNLLYSNKGLCNKIKLSQEYGFTSELDDYVLVQRVINSKGKIGEGRCMIHIEKDKLPSVKIQIVERDDDVNTIPNEIYRNEHLNFTCYLNPANYDIKNLYYEYIDLSTGKSICTIQGNIEGLQKIELNPGNYEAKQCMVLSNDLILTDKINFIVKEMQNPNVYIRNNNYKEEYTYLDKLDFSVYVSDMNRSEEHPFGYDLKSTYFIDDISYDGVFNEIDIKKLSKNSYHTISQRAVNSEHTDIFEQVDTKFYVMNIKPEINIISIGNLFVNEEREIILEVNDKDGEVIDVNAISNNNLQILNIERINESQNISSNKKGMGIYKIKVKGVFEGKGIVYISAVDDTLEENKKDIICSVSKSNINLDFYIDSINDVIFKENNYMKFIAKIKQNENKLNKAKNEISLEYYLDDVKVEININQNEFYEDDNLMLYMDKIEDNLKEFSLFFKKKGKYKFVSYAKDIYENCTNKEIILNIEEDIKPSIKLRLPENIYRNYETNESEVFGTIDVISDNDLENVLIRVYNDVNITSNNVQDYKCINEFELEKNYFDEVNSFDSNQKNERNENNENNEKNLIMYKGKLELDLGKNVLGKYFIEAIANKKRVIAASDSHPLYPYLERISKNSESAISSVNVLNTPPVIEFVNNNERRKIKRKEW